MLHGLCLCVCWTQLWALQKLLNQSTCRLVLDLSRPNEPCVMWGPRYPEEKGQLWGLFRHWNALDCASSEHRSSMVLHNTCFAGDSASHCENVALEWTDPPQGWLVQDNVTFRQNSLTTCCLEEIKCVSSGTHGNSVCAFLSALLGGFMLRVMASAVKMKLN